MKVVILSIYLLSIYLSIYLFARLYPYWNHTPPHPATPPHTHTQQHPTPPQPTLPYQQHPPLSLPYTASIPIEIRPKRPRAETTQDRNDPGPKRLTY